MSHGSIKSEVLWEAAKDLRYLLNRGYPRRTSLELVGNRYQLLFDHRHLLHRGVFSDADSKSRLKKIVFLKDLQSHNLAIDAYNVIITIEAALSGRPLVLGDDGFIRDISGLSGNFKRTEKTEEAIELLLKILKKADPSQALFLFDSPISRSGELTREVRVRMREKDLRGDAKALPVPEKVLIGFPGIVATSDTAIIDQSDRVVDLAGAIVKKQLSRRAKHADARLFCFV